MVSMGPSSRGFAFRYVTPPPLSSAQFKRFWVTCDMLGGNIWLLHQAHPWWQGSITVLYDSLGSVTCPDLPFLGVLVFLCLF